MKKQDKILERFEVLERRARRLRKAVKDAVAGAEAEKSNTELKEEKKVWLRKSYCG